MGRATAGTATRELSAATMGALIRRGLRLEYATLGWNVVGAVVVLGAAFAARSVALAGLVIVYYGINEGLHARRSDT